MTLEATVVGERAVRATAQGYEVDLGLPWYRSLPVSCLEDVVVTIGGRTAPRDALRVLRAGESLGIAALGDRVDDEWFVQDRLTVAVPLDAPAAKGDSVDVEVTVTLRVPYIIVGPGKALVRPTRVRRRVVVQ